MGWFTYGKGKPLSSGIGLDGFAGDGSGRVYPATPGVTSPVAFRTQGAFNAVPLQRAINGIPFSPPSPTNSGLIDNPLTNPATNAQALLAKLIKGG